LRERKEAHGSPVNKVDRVEGKELIPKRRANDCKGSCLSHRSHRSRDLEIMTVKVSVADEERWQRKASG